MNITVRLLTLVLLLTAGFFLKAQTITNNIIMVGAMKNVMWYGELYGNIDIDTIANKQHLYGFGPLEYLKGELLIIDGKSYKAVVLNDTAIQVEQTYKVKAPFFAYANISKWKEQYLPDSIQSLPQLEKFLDEISRAGSRPFLFKLIGTIDEAKIHIVNLPEGAKVYSPADAHLGLKYFKLINEQVEIIGFFSTEHKTIFTHHDTYLHLHLITADKNKMGHLEELKFSHAAIKLYLAAD